MDDDTLKIERMSIPIAMIQWSGRREGDFQPQPLFMLLSLCSLVAAKLDSSHCFETKIRLYHTLIPIILPLGIFLFQHSKYAPTTSVSQGETTLKRR